MVLGALVLALSACASEGAPTAGPRIFEPPPRSDARSAWLRVTPEGLRALPAIAAAVELDVPVPSAREGDLAICPDGGCSAALRGGEVEARLLPEPGLDVRAAVRARTSPIPVVYEQRWPCAGAAEPACEVVVDTEGAAPASLSAHARLRLGVDRRTSLVTLGAGELELAQGVDGGDVSVAGANLCGRVWCSAARLANVGERIATRIDDALEAQARARLDALTCRPCAAGCEPGSACVEGVCRRAPPNAEAPGACDPRPLGAAFEVGPDRSLGLTFALADEARAHRGGLDVAVRLGARPRVDALCVPDAPAPPPTPLPAAILERGSDAGAHVRVALGESALARAFWAAWRAGLGCAELGGEGSPVPLDLARLLPSSQSLAFLGVDAPRLRVRPTRAPEVRVEEDGAVAWAVPGLGLELEAEVDGRRLVLARATLRLAGVARLGVGEEGLWLGLEGTEAEVERIAAAPLLADDPETLAPTFDVLARLAVAAAPARVELGALPGPLRLVEPPRRVSHEDVRALALRLRVEAP